MKVIDNSNYEQKNKNIGINSIDDLKNLCYTVKNINILEQTDINWIKAHKKEVLELHEEFLLTKGSTEALCNLELIGEVYFGDLDLI